MRLIGENATRYCTEDIEALTEEVLAQVRQDPWWDVVADRLPVRLIQVESDPEDRELFRDLLHSGEDETTGCAGPWFVMRTLYEVCLDPPESLFDHLPPLERLANPAEDVVPGAAAAQLIFFLLPWAGYLPARAGEWDDRRLYGTAWEKVERMVNASTLGIRILREQQVSPPVGPAEAALRSFLAWGADNGLPYKRWTRAK